MPDVSKSVEWNDFIHAMADVGFTARSNGGSAVLFERNPQLGGKIVFHKPHPVTKIDAIMLRSMGKRMTKWFGWSRELFVLDDNGAGIHLGGSTNYCDTLWGDRRVNRHVTQVAAG